MSLIGHEQIRVLTRQRGFIHTDQSCFRFFRHTDVEVLSKFAQMEYKLGEPERGKTMFENILSSYPKRTDLWSIYIDMTIKQADTSDVRYFFQSFLVVVVRTAVMFLVCLSPTISGSFMPFGVNFKLCKMRATQCCHAFLVFVPFNIQS